MASPVLLGNDTRLNLNAADQALQQPSSGTIHFRRFSNIAPAVASSVVLGLGIAGMASLFVIIGLVQKGILQKGTPLFNKIFIPIRVASPLLVAAGAGLTAWTFTRCKTNQTVTKQLSNTQAREITAADALNVLQSFQFSSYKRTDLAPSELAVLDEIKRVFQNAVKQELNAAPDEFKAMIGGQISPNRGVTTIKAYWNNHVVPAELHEGNPEFNDNQAANMYYLRERLNLPLEGR